MKIIKCIKKFLLYKFKYIIMPKLLAEYKEIILKYADMYDPHIGPKPRYSNKLILKYVCMMLEDVVKWRSLQKLVLKDKY